ncbi:DUF3429 domain-containing protein [Chachezhania antarctica]|uniref:DUF3429 domain-containing protein n=1 Tax=Chachezhania antarctica TaxID=2340860 RepID=UPI000EB367FF|nr:DUF3429 domain-containing protein [Chachezhania antarctica]
MTRMPPIVAILSYIALIPFLWGAASYLLDPLARFGSNLLGPRFVGPYVQLFYGAVLLSFQSGVLWSFCLKQREGVPGIAYVIAMIPALWAFLMTGNGPVSASLNLLIGFAGLLVLDIAFTAWDLAPRWWMRLRLPVVLITCACLAVSAFL